MRVGEAYKDQALSIDEMDGLSFDYGDWHFNLRKSNTDPSFELSGNFWMMIRRMGELL